MLNWSSAFGNIAAVVAAAAAVVVVVRVTTEVPLSKTGRPINPYSGGTAIVDGV